MLERHLVQAKYGDDPLQNRGTGIINLQAILLKSTI